MERKRPEYLPPIEKPRWSFPWLTVIGISVLALAVFGVKQHLATQAAWNQRFNRPAPTTMQAPLTLEQLKAQAEREAKSAEVRLRRAVAEREAAEKEREQWRCINHIPFRQIPGGWENVPGESC